MIQHINNEGEVTYHMTPQLWTVKARLVTDTGRVLKHQNLPDLTESESRAAMGRLTRLGWECVRCYQ